MSSKQDLTKQFTAEEGIIHIGGIEALVRLTMDQIRFDRRRGLNNAMFISGYRGSPVGMLDANFIKQQKLLMQHNIQFVDGLNEDLAATAVWGTQMMHTVGNQKFDGVVGTWYGKAPGVDRSGDVLKHANYTGTLRNGGVLAIFGDDPSCKSSSLPSQSEAMFYHVGIPSLYPANVQDILDFGLHGYYLSRISGLWAGLKIVTNVADGSGSAIVDPDRMKFVTPVVELDGRPFIDGRRVDATAGELSRFEHLLRLHVLRFPLHEPAQEMFGIAVLTELEMQDGRLAQAVTMVRSDGKHAPQMIQGGFRVAACRGDHRTEELRAGPGLRGLGQSIEGGRCRGVCAGRDVGRGGAQ